MNECTDNLAKKSDAELNNLYQQIRQRLKDDAATANLLVASQRDWVAFRDAECTFIASGTVGGTIHSQIFGECANALTKKRVADFKAYLSCDEHDLSCPVPGPN